MYTRQTTVCNASGLHARPAASFVKTAAKFKSSIKIGKAASASAVDAKSLVTVLSLTAARGDLIEISAEGEDEHAAVDALVAVVDSGFKEVEK